MSQSGRAEDEIRALGCLCLEGWGGGKEWADHVGHCGP